MTMAASNAVAIVDLIIDIVAVCAATIAIVKMTMTPSIESKRQDSQGEISRLLVFGGPKDARNYASSSYVI